MCANCAYRNFLILPHVVVSLSCGEIHYRTLSIEQKKGSAKIPFVAEIKDLRSGFYKAASMIQRI